MAKVAGADGSGAAMLMALGMDRAPPARDSFDASSAVAGRPNAGAAGFDAAAAGNENAGAAWDAWPKGLLAASRPPAVGEPASPKLKRAAPVAGCAALSTAAGGGADAGGFASLLCFACSCAASACTVCTTNSIRGSPCFPSASLHAAL